MNVTLPDVFDLSSLLRALDEDVAAQEHAAIDCVPMDVDDEWAPTPLVDMNNPWYNPEPPGWFVDFRASDEPLRHLWSDLLPRSWRNPKLYPAWAAWNDVGPEPENGSVEKAPEAIPEPVEKMSEDVPGWSVNLRGPNEQLYHAWRDWNPPTLPVVCPRPFVPPVQTHSCLNPELQPALNDLEQGLERPGENAQDQVQDTLGCYVNLRESNYEPPCTGYKYLPIASVRRVKRVEKIHVREDLAPPPVVSAKRKRVEDVLIDDVPVSTVKDRAPLTPVPARKAGKSRVPGIRASTRKAEKARAPGVVALTRNTVNAFVPSVSASTRRMEKARVPSTPSPPPHISAPSKSTSVYQRPSVPPRVDFSNMSSSSKVKLEDMPPPKVDKDRFQMRTSWPIPVCTNKTVSSKAMYSHPYRITPVTWARQPPADEDVAMFDNNCLNAAVHILTKENGDATSDDALFIHSTDPVQPVVDHIKDGSSAAEHSTVVEDDVTSGDAKEDDPSSAGNAKETGDENGEETEEETEEERKARVAQLMAEVFGDGEDSDEEPPVAKDVPLDHSSTSAIPDSLTADATESITDWSLNTPDDAGTEGNDDVGVADRDEQDEERQAQYRAQLLVDIFGDDVEGSESVEGAPQLLVPIPTLGDSGKRKREDDGPSTMPATDPRKRKREDDGPSTTPTTDPRKRKRDDSSTMSCYVTTDPRKGKREDDGSSTKPCYVTTDPRKRKREDGSSTKPCYVTTDPRRRKREDDGSSTMSCYVTTDPRKRKREDDDSSRTMSCYVTTDPRKRKREDDALAPATFIVNRPALSLVTRDPRKRLKG